MHNTFRVWGTLQPTRRPSNASSREPSVHSPTFRPNTESLRPASDAASFTSTRRTGSTVWGPGALTGKLLKRFGENVERGAEYVIIRTTLSKFERIQPELLGSAGRLTSDQTLEMDDMCPKLVDLCIVGMGYPSRLMTRAFTLILRGFKLPGRKSWSYHIAEAIAKREIMDVFEFFQEGFFTLLDDSIFRIDGFVALETLSFRCPAVAHEIATIISHLAQRDRGAGSAPVPVASALSLSLSSDTAAGEVGPEIRPSFSGAIIQAGFFRLVDHWVDHGLPHWDQRGIERLESALQDVAYAQEYQGDLNNPGEARDLILRLKRRRLLLLDDVEELPELEEYEIDESESH